jgi:hypothetical protein
MPSGALFPLNKQCHLAITYCLTLAGDVFGECLSLNKQCNLAISYCYISLAICCSYIAKKKQSGLVIMNCYILAGNFGNVLLLNMHWRLGSTQLLSEQLRLATTYC